MSEINEYADEFFADTRPKSFEKIVLNKVVNATVKDVSAVKSNQEDMEDTDKKGNKFNKLFFTVVFELDEPVGDKSEIYESYGFRYYPADKSVWYGGKTSSCGKLVDVATKYISGLSNNPSPVELKNSLLGRKVKIVSEPFGPNKSMKTMIASFV